MSKKSKLKTLLKSSEPASTAMDELLKKYSPSIRSLKVGDEVVGTVMEITSDTVFLDIGGKSEAVVSGKAYKEAESLIKTLKVGDKVRGRVLVSESKNGFAILSLRAALYERLWEKVMSSMQKGEILEVNVKSSSSSGLLVNIDGLIGFIPRSQLGKEALKNPEALVGKTLKAIVIDAQRQENKVILSEKEVSEAEELALVRDAIKRVEEGEVFEGEVSAIYDFGCFVRIGVPKGTGEESQRKKTNKKKSDVIYLEGLVHVSELSWDKVDKPEDVVKVGDKVKVKVIGKTQGKLALSIKQTQENPWQRVDEKYKKDSTVKGKVSRVSDFGIFVLLEPGVEGLVHITKIPPGKRFTKGDEVDVYIEDVDAENRKISLGLVLTEKPVGYK